MNVKFLEWSNVWSGTSNTQQHPSTLQHPSTYQQGRKALASRQKELDEQQQAVEEEGEVLKKRSDEVVICHMAVHLQLHPTASKGLTLMHINTLVSIHNIHQHPTTSNNIQQHPTASNIQHHSTTSNNIHNTKQFTT